MLTFLDIAEKTLELVRKPLAPIEIWDNAEKLNITDGFITKGKTPWQSIGAQLYVNIRDHEDSRFVQVSKRPTKFFLKRLITNEEELQKEVELEIEKSEKRMTKSLNFKERDLHPLLVKYINSDSHFKAYSRTIFHETSRKTMKGINHWLHPDIVGVYFPFNDYSKDILEVQKTFSVNAFKLYSFEMKISISFSNLRECYFQAVSNSSWANEGYLVVLRIKDDTNLYDELRRLNNAFGIGIIRLNVEDVEQSEILFPAKVNDSVDWDTANRLAEENPNFKEFLLNILEDIKLGKIKSNYDDLMNEEEYEKLKKLINS